MSKALQSKGMQHIFDIKREAMDMWKEYDRIPSMWINCLECVLQEHRMRIFQEKQRQELKSRENSFVEYD